MDHLLCQGPGEVSRLRVEVTQARTVPGLPAHQLVEIGIERRGAFLRDQNKEILLRVDLRSAVREGHADWGFVGHVRSAAVVGAVMNEAHAFGRHLDRDREELDCVVDVGRRRQWRIFRPAVTSRDHARSAVLGREVRQLHHRVQVHVRVRPID